MKMCDKNKMTDFVSQAVCRPQYFPSLIVWLLFLTGELLIVYSYYTDSINSRAAPSAASLPGLLHSSANLNTAATVLPTSEYGRVLVYDLLRLGAGVVEPDGLRLQVVVFRRQVFSKDRPVWESRKRERTVHNVWW